MEPSIGQIILSIKEISSKITYMERVFILGLMEELMMVIFIESSD
jgi:hypothetical protein